MSGTTMAPVSWYWSIWSLVSMASSVWPDYTGCHAFRHDRRRRGAGGALPALHQLHHDALRTADEREARSRIARQRPDRDIGALAAQFLAGGIDVIDGQPDVLQAVIRELRRAGGGVVRMRRRDQHLLAADLHRHANLARIQRAGRIDAARH